MYVLIYNTHTHTHTHTCILSRCHVPHFATPRTAACHAPLSMGFPRQEYLTGQPFPSPESLLGIEPVSPASPELAGGFFNH